MNLQLNFVTKERILQQGEIGCKLTERKLSEVMVNA